MNDHLAAPKQRFLKYLLATLMINRVDKIRKKIEKHPVSTYPTNF
jgi:hypothetical protein